MRKFWSMISNGEYSVGCTGQTVYVYDANGVEKAKFKDLIYAYTSAISPKGNIFVVKSAEGRMAVYSLREMRLIQKFRFSKTNAADDDPFCFSPDGERFYNIERRPTGLQTALSIYRTSDFSLEARLFEGDEKTVLDSIEADGAVDNYYILGGLRNDEGIITKFFVARLHDDRLQDLEFITKREYDYYVAYKRLELMGFTEKSKAWSSLRYYDGYDLKNIENQRHSLAGLWKYYHS